MPRKFKQYKPTKFGEGIQPGTVDWEMQRRQFVKRQRLEDEAFEEKVSRLEEAEPKGVWRVWDAIARFFR